MTAPPHIMIVLNRLGTGGAERVTLHLANGLAARGNRVTLVLISNGGVLEDKIGPEVELVRLNRSLERGAGMLRAAPQVARIIRSARPDIVLSPANHMNAMIVLAHRLASSNSRLTLKLTNPVERTGAGALRNRARRVLFRFAARSADLILALSTLAAEEAARVAPASAAKLRVVANPYVEDPLLDRAERRPEEPPLLLSVGRLTPQKDPLLMIEALAGLKDRPWRLAMLGEGPLLDRCRERVAQLGIADRVDFPGFDPNPAPWFGSARLFLLSSRYEELPAVLFEALAARCPIVSTAASASVVQALDSGRLGRLVPPGDAGRFRTAIGEALDGPREGPDAGEWLNEFTMSAGVESHAKALGLL